MEKCPVFEAADLSNEHLIQEYKDMQSARFGVFKNNAIATQNAVAELLLIRGITHISSIFGDIPIKAE